MTDKKDTKNIEALEKEIRTINDASLVILIDKLLRISEEDSKKLAFKTIYEIPPSVSIIKSYENTKRIHLPKPLNSATPICETLLKRRSEREYIDAPLSLPELSTLLTYSYGISSYVPAYNYSSFPLRTAPSGGALQSIELYCVVNKVEGIEEGLYHFNPINNSLETIFNGFCIGKMLEFCRGQEFILKASVIFILTAILNKGLWKYSTFYYKIALIDSGCVAENIHLVATSIGLASCMIGGFSSDKVSKFLQLDNELEIPVIMISVGKKRI